MGSLLLLSAKRDKNEAEDIARNHRCKDTQERARSVSGRINDIIT